MSNKTKFNTIIKINDERTRTHHNLLFVTATLGIQEAGYLLDFPYTFCEMMTVEELGQLFGGN